MQEGKNIILKYTKNWRLMLGLESVLYGLGAGLCIGLISKGLILGFTAFIVVTFGALLIIRPWKISIEGVSNYIDHHLNTAEYSTSLLLASSSNLSGLAQLQQEKIKERLKTELRAIKPKTGLKKALIVAIVLMIIGFIAYLFCSVDSNSTSPKGSENQIITFQSTDSVAPAHIPPILINQELNIRYPEYTRLSSRNTSIMNVKVVEGSRLSWTLNFNGAVGDVQIEGFGEDMKMDEASVTKSNALSSSFVKSVIPEISGYYNFRFSDTLGANYASEIYAIEIVEDKAPTVEIKDVAQFSSFDYSDNKEFSFTTEIADDYGIAGAEIIATVSKGSGESVKFREEKIAFDQSVQVGGKLMRLSKNLNLDQLKMDVGDELYFYVEARDQKKPRPNVTRSETYFAVIKDTVSDSFGVEGTLGADLMPDYFRSQRQLIIDTEKLINERSQLTDTEFKSRSNDLGFDQKALRLKYGQFMGDEADSGIAVTPEISAEAFDADDPTAGFRHDHDGDNEHNLVKDDHGHEDEEEQEQEQEKSILEGYVHNHDDPEESTLFTESLRGKLKHAMAEMWDAELHLRLATPKKSLPYQYNALRLIQEIKNSARIYVHRIGFDPPPIKEEKRLTGDLEEIDNYYKNENLGEEDQYQSIRASIRILEKRIEYNEKLTRKDKEAFARAGEELATIAINEPAKHLKTLQQLKWITEEREEPIAVLRAVQSGLLRALPEDNIVPTIREQYRGALEKVFMKELQAGD